MTGLIRSFAGKHPRLDPEAFVAETAVVIGDVEVGPGSSVWYGCVLRGDLHRITIGRGSNIQDGTVIHENSDRDGDGGMPTTIGDEVVIGHMALIHACTLGDRSFVGMGAIVMDGAVVEPDAMVAAGALVTPRKLVRSGELWAGRPARFLRKLGEAELAERAYIARHYAELAAAYLAERRD
ncbi:MAG: gamma carbonic anhydrase family protein [Kiloniellales bacterium]